MAYEAATGVIQAARRYRSGTEDFLTELFAAALTAHVPLANALCDEVDPQRSARHRVRTHVTERLPEGRLGFVEMELEIQNSRGGPTGELWAEHKTHCQRCRQMSFPATALAMEDDALAVVDTGALGERCDGGLRHLGVVGEAELLQTFDDREPRVDQPALLAPLGAFLLAGRFSR
jgi:hypothetical protein